jgi:hypothetical protein
MHVFTRRAGLGAGLALLFLCTVSGAQATPTYHFTLSCAGCSVPDESVSWDSESNAALASGFSEDAPGSFFHIQVSVSGTSSGIFDFYGHTLGIDGGWNLCRTGFCYNSAGFNGSVFSSGIDLLYTQGGEQLIFTGDTSDPVWALGTYVGTDSYYGSGGELTLTIAAAAVAEPGGRALLGFGLAGLGAMRRRRTG